MGDYHVGGYAIELLPRNEAIGLLAQMFAKYITEPGQEMS